MVGLQLMGLVFSMEPVQLVNRWLPVGLLVGEGTYIVAALLGESCGC
jgi:hypothetical protein